MKFRLRTRTLDLSVQTPTLHFLHLLLFLATLIYALGWL